MKFIITENRLNKVILNWLNKRFSLDQLEIVESEKHPNSIFFKKNGKVVMEQDKLNKDFWFDYDQIWYFFENFFEMKDSQIRELLITWLKETLNLEGYTPFFGKELMSFSEIRPSK